MICAGNSACREAMRLMPAIFVTYSFAYVDRANYGFGAAAATAADLHVGDTTRPGGALPRLRHANDDVSAAAVMVGWASPTAAAACLTLRLRRIRATSF